MIVTCGQCGVKLKVDDSKIAERGSRIKCPKCANIFAVYRPEAPVEAPQAPPPPVEEMPVPPPPPEMREEPLPPPPPAEKTPAPPPPPEEEEPVAPPPPPVEEEPVPPPVSKWALDGQKVVVAHDGESVLSLIDGLLTDAGYQVITESEGVQAMVAIEREKPFMAILDVALPRIYGFEICDRLKNNPESSGIKVILIASIYDKTRYKREPVSLYGADDYIEKHHIQDCIVQKVQRLGMGPEAQGPSFPREEETCRHPAEEEVAGRQAQAEQMRKDEIEEFPAASPVDPQQVEAARRFARIILSDIALYNQGAVDEGIRNGTFKELLTAELKEGRDLYDGRVSEDVRMSMDYFGDEMEKFIEKKLRTLELG